MPPSDPAAVSGGPVQTVDRVEPPPPHPSANRQLVVCLDGTNNTLTAGVRDTNVLQLFEILRARVGDARQVLYYDPGVGSASALPPTGVSGFVTQPLRRIAGLALGSGVYDNIGQAYLHLCREYGALEPADATATLDEIYLFGFSRGAFTARAVAGMVNLFGLIRPEHDVLLPTLLRVYFSGDPGAQTLPGGHGSSGPGDGTERGGAAAADDSALAQFAREVRERAAAAGPGPDGRATMGATARRLQRLRVALDPVPEHVAAAVPGHRAPLGQIRRADVARQIREQFTSPVGREAWVHFVGVWDTVDSVGLPGLRKRITSSATVTGKRFRHVRHALALDEHRRQFLPRPYVGTPDPGTPDVDPGQTLKQLWFRGVHTDIGGGRPISLTRMSSETMHWMVTEARSIGLRCPDVPVATDPLPEIIGDQLRAQPLWAITGMAVRSRADAPAGTIHAAGAVLEPAAGPVAAAPRPSAGPFEARPLEHPSVRELSPPRPGELPATPVPRPPGSPWARGNGPRLQAWLTPLLVAAVLIVVGWIAAGANVGPGPMRWHVWTALQDGARLSAKQVTTFWWPPSAQHELTRQAIADRPGHHASFGWGMGFALAFELGVATILARLVARAFGRMTMWARIGDPSPRWHPSALGLGFPALILGAITQGLAMVLAWDVGDSVLRYLCLAVASVASLIAVVGAGLVVALVVRWLVLRAGRTP